MLRKTYEHAKAARPGFPGRNAPPFRRPRLRAVSAAKLYPNHRCLRYDDGGINPPTKQMKLVKSLNCYIVTSVAALAALVPSIALAQTNAPVTNAPSLNIFEQALQSTIVNTNSTFFDSGGLELRALTQTTVASYQSVLSGTYYFTNNVGIGAELVNGAFNVVDAASLTLEYGIPYHNVKLVPVAGIGYDLLNRGPAVQVGLRLEVALSQNMFADTEDVLEIPTHDFTGNNISDSFRIGIGWKF